MSMMVAVAARLSAPPQQSAILGQRASSHTVCRLRPRRSALMRLKLSVLGMGVFEPVGEARVRALAAGGADLDGAEGVSVFSGGETKSANEGPALRRSLKDGGWGGEGVKQPTGWRPVCCHDGVWC